MNSWINGEKGSEVRRIIDNNFDILDKRTIKINKDISKMIPLGIDFVVSDWVFTEGSQTYTISIPYEVYSRVNPCVEVYIKNKDGYSFVYAGHMLREYGIDLQSDMPYEGRVVIR